MPSRSWLSLANGAPPFNIFELLATFPLAVSHRIKVSLNRMFDRKKPPLGIEREAMAYDQYLVNPWAILLPCSTSFNTHNVTQPFFLALWRCWEYLY